MRFLRALIPALAAFNVLMAGVVIGHLAFAPSGPTSWIAVRLLAALWVVASTFSLWLATQSPGGFLEKAALAAAVGLVALGSAALVDWLYVSEQSGDPEYWAAVLNSTVLMQGAATVAYLAWCPPRPAAT